MLLCHQHSRTNGQWWIAIIIFMDIFTTIFEHFFYRRDRESVRELADLWDPLVPVANNKAYIERSKELHAELEAALVSHLDDGKSAPKPKQEMADPKTDKSSDPATTPRTLRKSRPGDTFEE
jgi:hypothetical protein